MTPIRDTLNIRIDRGNTLSFGLTFSDMLSGAELDMESYAPFSGVVCHASRTAVLATLIITATGGTLNVLLESPDTVDLALTGNVPHVWGIKDSQGTLWIDGKADVVGSPIEN